MGDSSTPWQRVFAKFGLPQAQLAKGIGRHRSKLSRALKDDRGLINGSDQARLMEFAKEAGVSLQPADLTPEAR